MPDEVQAATAATVQQRFFSTPILDPESYAAGFAAVRRNMPTPQADGAPVAVFINRANLDAFLDAAPVTLAGRRDGGR